MNTIIIVGMVLGVLAIFILFLMLYIPNRAEMLEQVRTKRLEKEARIKQKIEAERLAQERRDKLTSELNDISYDINTSENNKIPKS